MSVKYNNKNGVLQNISGLTPGGDISFGAVTTRSGSVTFTSVAANATGNIIVTFTEPMPDADYEVTYTIVSGTSDGSLGKTLCPLTYQKTETGFKALLYNGDTAVKTNITFVYKAFKLYDVADAEALYSDVTDIKSYIPSNASSSNKLSTANDLRTETRSLDRRIDDLEDVVPSDAGILNMLVTQDDLSGVEIDKVEDINDVELTSIQDGQTLIWDATNSKWVNGQGGKTYSAGNGINISGADEISTNTDNTSVVIGNNKELKVADTYKTTFVGTTAAWNALSVSDKAKYNLVSLTDDAYGSAGVTDAVTDGDMRPVTSNAVYDGLSGKANSATSIAGYGITDAYTKTEVNNNFQAKLTNPLTKADVVNNLTSTTTNVPLSAAQGKALNDKIPFGGNQYPSFVHQWFINNSSASFAYNGNLGVVLFVQTSSTYDAIIFVNELYGTLNVHKIVGTYTDYTITNSGRTVTFATPGVVTLTAIGWIDTAS